MLNEPNLKSLLNPQGSESLLLSENPTTPSDDPTEVTIRLKSLSGRFGGRGGRGGRGGNGGGGRRDGGSGNGGPETCELVVVNLAAYHDDELDPDTQRVVSTHLAHCADCAAALEALQKADRLLEREWRDSTPLPSSSDFANSIDSIMDALPAPPEAKRTFAPKRVHARLRWTRFSTGMASLFAFFAATYSAYQIGYVNGRDSLLSHIQPGMTLQPAAAMPQRLSAVSYLMPGYPVLKSATNPTASSTHPPATYSTEQLR